MTLAICGTVLATPAGAAAAGPPQIISTAVEGVSATGATLQASINPDGSSTTYRFEYMTAVAYQANLVASREPFQGASFAPPSGIGGVGAGSTSVSVSQHPTGLAPSTAYRYRLRAVNTVEPVFSPVRPFTTEAPTNVFELLDGRGWEMVSPIDKDGGAIQEPGAIAGGGVFQAAAGGGAITYSSSDSFGEPQGAPAGSQYVAVHGEGADWANSNITTPLLSGSYGSRPDGVPYQLFSPDLSSSLLSNGERCRGESDGECPVANPPPPGSGAPAGYRDYYRRNASGGFDSILTAADLSHTSLGPQQFEMRLLAATPDLAHVVLSSCAALTADATEMAAPGGCDPADQNLYEWSGGTLALINLLPHATTGTPGAALGAASGAVSSDGSRVYFTIGGDIYLRNDGTTETVLAGGEPGQFQVASTDGSIAYVLQAGKLLSFQAATETLTPITSGSGVEGVLGASADGSRVYYSESGALFLGSNSTDTEIAGAVAPTDWPPATGTSRISADGLHLLFLSAAELTGSPNEGQMEAFLFGPPPGGGAPTLSCVSCNPAGERPAGPASIPGAIANGTGPGATDSYKPRALSAEGNRVFFDSSDSLVQQDTNNRTDVYEWEAGGVGTCTAPGGCVDLISTGRSPEASTFLDASADGSDAFFLTSESIYPPDPGSYDIYDARIGGSFMVPGSTIPCDGDACQALPEAPEDPTPGTLVSNSGNPPLRVAGEKAKTKKKHAKKKRRKKHAKKKTGKHQRGDRAGRTG